MTKLWQPSPERIAATELFAFCQALGFVRDGAVDYARAHAWSIASPQQFWGSLWLWCDVRGDKRGRIFEPRLDMQTARFFPDARINFAENLLLRDDDSEALVALGEDGATRRVTWRELKRGALGFAAWLKQAGIRPGDRVAAIMPNIAETVMAMLGTAAIGAAFSSCSPDFGAAGIVDRFGQIAPRVLVACDGYRYNGKTFDVRGKIRAVLRELRSVEHVVMVPYLGLGVASGAQPWSDVANTPSENAGFARFPFRSPLYILFSSGTTGTPKCIAHSAGGTLMQHMKEHRFHCDINPGDRVFFFTTCGWMMWNWLMSALASQATLLLYDGSPFHPDGNVLFDFATRERATFFGVSAKYLDAVKKAGLKPIATHDLSTIKTIASTGSPLAPESFDFVYEHVAKDVQLASMSGGTDIVSCFMLGNPCAPVYRGEIQAPGLGMAVEIWDDAGKRVIGEQGELVCTRPFPSMPVGFWNDIEEKKYHAAYFERFPGVWCHGDYVIETEHGGYVMLGRSDATLNPGGVRIGTAELYRQVETLDQIVEAVAVAQDWDGDVRVVLFVVLRPGARLDQALVDDIKSRIRTGASPRHVPAKIVAVPDIPRTKSGKISELAVRDVIHGCAVKNTEALANPEALEHFKNLPELAT